MTEKNNQERDDPNKGYLELQAASNTKNQGLHGPLHYVWKPDRKVPDEVRDALVKADQLLRRIAQQVMRIDPSGKLRREIDTENGNGAPEQPRFAQRVWHWFTGWATDFFLSKDDSKMAVAYLNDAADQTRHYIEYYLVKTNDPKNLILSLHSIEGQLVNGGLRYRLHALMRSALLLVLAAISFYCLLWMAANDIYQPINDNIDSAYKEALSEYNDCAERQEQNEDLLCDYPSRQDGVPRQSEFWRQAIHSFPLIKSFAVLAIGLFSGRFLYIFMSKPAARDTFESYYVIERQLETPVSDILADNFVAFCATILFLSGILVVGIGATESYLESSESPNVQAGFVSSLNIGRAEVALAFGVLIGLARQQFIGRIKNVAETTVGQGGQTSAQTNL